MKDSAKDKQALSRRQFLLGKFRAASVEASTASNRSKSVPYPKTEDDLLATRGPGTPRQNRRYNIPLLRPPGAVDEATFLSKCTQCGDCITACPPKAIVKAPLMFRAAAGTPMLDPATAGCQMCSDTPCITACPEGVLSIEVPLRMGTARIDTQVCLAYRGTLCSLCHDRCPVPQAIRVDNGRPTVVEDLCTGCGTCQHVCPAPHNAVVILPMLARPQRSQPTQGMS